MSYEYTSWGQPIVTFHNLERSAAYSGTMVLINYKIRYPDAPESHRMWTLQIQIPYQTVFDLNNLHQIIQDTVQGNYYLSTICDSAVRDVNIYLERYEEEHQERVLNSGGRE